MPCCYEREQRRCIDVGFFDEQHGFVTRPVWTKKLLEGRVFVLLVSIGKL
jgi:hypothetical protein